MSKKNIFLCFLLIFSAGLFAQTTDLARVEYLHIPFSKSDNSISRYRALIQAPIPINKEKKNYLIVGLEYRYVDISIKDDEDVAAFQGLNLETGEVQNNLVTSVKQIDAYMGYTWSAKNNWRFGVKFGTKFQSDFNDGLQKDDVIYEGAVYAIKDMKKDTLNGNKPYRLIMGLTYGTTPGRGFPLPLINYYKEFKPNWTYTLGVPKTNVRYYFNDSHKDAIQAFATIDNIYANFQQNFVPFSPSQNPDAKIAESIQQTIVIAGLGYEHNFTKHLLLYVYAAHSVYNDFRLENDKGDKVYKISEENTPYFRTGLKFKY